MSDLPNKTTVVGAGDIGAGWAALLVGAGWPVSLYDTDARRMDAAMESVPQRARALVDLQRATPGTVERGLREFSHAHSILQACKGADWVIEATSEDLMAKQRVFQSLDEVAEPHAIITSSSSGLKIEDIAARCRNQGRCMVAHPLNPPELIPLIELIPGRIAKPEAVAQAQTYLRALGRIPITLKKSVPGHVVGRIAAAVWRESIQLVLDGVVDVDDLDRAISLGPALGWAAAGPHLSYHLAAGQGGVRGFLQQLMQSFETWWSGLAKWDKLDFEQQQALVNAIERSYHDNIGKLRGARDRRLSAIVRALEESRQ
jgi:carnitine 3-dehydrogenase